MIQRSLYIERIKPFMGKDIVKVLTGIRRCGKSVMLQLLQSELQKSGVSGSRIFSVNFETKSADYVKSADASYKAVKEFAGKQQGKIYLFLDEIQELPEWETFVNSCMVDFDADIYITGSNAKLLSGELATYLAGRYVEFKIYPLSFAEALQMMPDKTLAEAFGIYLVRGGMPFLYQHMLDESSSRQYLEDIYSSIVLKDIAQRNCIRDMEQLKRLLFYFISNVGNTFSSTNIVKYLKNEKRGMAMETLYNYIDYCRTACLLHLVPREDVLGKKLLQFQEKIYLADHGLREAVCGTNMRDINQTLENIVYMELVRRGFDVAVGKAGESEIDFVAARNAEKIYVQVSYLLAGEETLEREFGALEKVQDNYPKYVVSMDEIDRSHNGIKHMNVRDFLLREKYSL